MDMELKELLILVATGGIAGWLAGLILRKGSLNLVGNIVVGVLGAFIGAAIFRMLEIRLGNPYVELLVMATVGAVILLFVISLLRKLVK